MDSYQKAVRAFVEEALRVTSLDLTNLARKSGLRAPSTLTRFMNGEVKHALSLRTLAKISAYTGVPLPAALGASSDASFSEQAAAAVEHGMLVRELNPAPGDPIYDWNEAALLGLWRKLSLTKRAALFDYLGSEMPSLRKSA